MKFAPVVVSVVLAVQALAACHSLEIKTIPAADGLPAQRCTHEKVKFVFKFNDVLRCEPLSATSDASAARP